VIELQAGWVLWFLLPALAAWATLWLTKEIRGNNSPALAFSSLVQLSVEPSRLFYILRLLTKSLRILCLGLLTLAVARPQILLSESKVYSDGIDIMLAVDTSGSMNALDLDSDRPIRERRTRLEVVKAVVEGFVEGRPADQIGMVVFGKWAFTQCPLTLDHGILRSFIGGLEVGLAGRQTAIGDALGIAAKRLKESKADSRVIILLTDGRNNAGQLDPIKAAEIAKALGIRVYTIGAGTRGEAPVIDVSRGRPMLTKVNTAIDDEALNQIAKTTGGAYFRAEDVRALAKVYEQIDEMEKTAIEQDTIREAEERYPPLIVSALLLLLFEVTLLATRLRTIP